MSIIEFKGVFKRFGLIEVLKGIDLSINPREIVFLVGPSGSGKSTLLRCINALESISGGDLIVDGLSVRGSNRQVRQIRLEAGMVFQQFNLFPHLNALENVMFGPLKARGASRAEAKEIAQGLLEKVGLADRMHNYPSELSGGQQQRTAIARALAVKPRLMLFDEPTSALDPELRYEVLQVMRQLADEGMTMVVVTHEIKFARDVGSRLLFLDKGQIQLDDKPTNLLGAPPSERFASFLQHVS
ncbi:glutamine ABC transporter ATP-binding protein GlnQ [Mesorhizobium sp. M7A.F.Ca.US.006.01.1.1]|uniref:glutamine ABC transporter ATP-binding protein GlnQ n=1 Tax=Mesorhizobium sp. M7A.F.Ca.US.006.01.1.1 TaxID=2496707 RepID=UPI000FCC8B0A|nr:glutamine ABC transporter ATP-binding protein GlnQ [Mesorhizobium sp. M7A.F.Ca.US.006.01.1.1]RUZ75212.1 glutamine ABC transporter ATP-binding protein GlnQ [Mesorhizobium sp. M7A.F.Ca.US.006.01.1.1]